MSLYPDARSSLPQAERETLDLWEVAAEAVPSEGPNVVANIRNESHLVGNPPKPDSFALKAFLARIGDLVGTAGAREAFKGAAKDHILQGRPLASNPPMLHRFRTIDAFGRSVAQANGETLQGKNPEEYVTNLLENWETLGREKVSRAMLGAGPLVFVTFQSSDRRLVTDLFRFGPGIMSALGVRLQEDQDVIDLKYPLAPDAPLKYPTSADGGWNQDFAVCGPADPHGWTRPVSDPTSEGWPEAVHKNRRADLAADRPSRYPG